MAEVVRTMDAEWLAKIIGTDRRAYYFCFVLSLLQLRFFHFPRAENFAIVGTSRNETAESFGVITMNYDIVIERIVSVINQTATGGISPPPPEWKTRTEAGGNGQLAMAKLHGSIQSQIVAATWNKGKAEAIRDAWKLAYELLSSANHIRFIGYSMPITDNYVKYLFTAALSQSFNLKTVDVITLDSDGSTAERYRRLFEPCPNFRFANSSVIDYLRYLYGQMPYNSNQSVVKEKYDFPAGQGYMLNYSAEHIHRSHNGFMQENKIAAKR